MSGRGRVSEDFGPIQLPLGNHNPLDQPSLATPQKRDIQRLEQILRQPATDADADAGDVSLVSPKSVKPESLNDIQSTDLAYRLANLCFIRASSELREALVSLRGGLLEGAQLRAYESCGAIVLELRSLEPAACRWIHSHMQELVADVATHLQREVRLILFEESGSTKCATSGSSDYDQGA